MLRKLRLRQKKKKMVYLQKKCIPEICCREIFYAVDQCWKNFYKVIKDKVTEITLKRDAKAPSRTTGFSTNTNVVEKWKINGLYWESLRRAFHRHLHYKCSKYDHKDISERQKRYFSNSYGFARGFYQFYSWTPTFNIYKYAGDF